MTRQLTIDSDEAYEIAHRLAEREGASVTEVVEEALRRFSNRLKPSSRVTPEEAEESYQALRALAREGGRHRKAGVSSDHSDMYDEYGLPL